MNATQPQAYAKMEVHVLLILTIPTASSVLVLQDVREKNVKLTKMTVWTFNVVIMVPALTV